MASLPVLQEETWFRKGFWSYRIPALLYMPQSCMILAFAEEREDEVDEHAKLIVMRRGTYDGTTHHVQWIKMETIVNAQLEGHRSMNPCLVYNEVTGNLILFFIAVPGKVSENHQIKTKTSLVHPCQVTSTDNGCSWSPAKDLTETVIGTAHKDWATFAVGPGHGLQLLNEARSLVIPAYTWAMGNFVAKEHAVECQVAGVHSRGERVVYCNARSSQGARVQAVSYNHGMDFDSGQRIEKLVEPPHGCHGSVIGFPSPANVKSGYPAGRRNLGVYLNKCPLDLACWIGPTLIFKGLCAYSDLQHMERGPDGSPLFCCLFEFGTSSQYKEIIFLMFTLKQAFPSECGAAVDRPIQCPSENHLT
uniref:exo-alpha-sialidase n=1 Tax=Chelonoidis abingdonii TaxID=106734 RepID=A0A8C0QLV9_CHEAB